MCHLKQRFFSIQADTTTDCGNIEDELYMVVYFDPHTQDGAVHVRDRFLTVRRPSRCDAKGLYECFERALTYVGVTDWQTKLIGFGCDGTNVNPYSPDILYKGQMSCVRDNLKNNNNKVMT